MKLEQNAKAKHRSNTYPFSLEFTWKSLQNNKLSYTWKAVEELVSSSPKVATTAT